MIKINKKQKGIIFYKYNGHCAYCGKKLDPFGDWQIDHVIPKYQKGSDNIDNLVLSCKKCNGAKRHRKPDEYKKWMLKKIINNCDKLLLSIQNTEKYQFKTKEKEDIHRKKCLKLIKHLYKELPKIKITFFYEFLEEQKENK